MRTRPPERRSSEALFLAFLATKRKLRRTRALILGARLFEPDHFQAFLMIPLACAVKIPLPATHAPWMRLVLRPTASVDVDDISATVEAVFIALEEFGPQGVDFSSLAPEAVNAEHLAAALRVCAPLSESIPSWTGGLLVAIDACALQGVDARDALAGLL